eukprot:364896-Chlamydomonas_euryale.AAC.7
MAWRQRSLAGAVVQPRARRKAVSAGFFVVEGSAFICRCSGTRRGAVLYARHRTRALSSNDVYQRVRVRVGACASMRMLRPYHACFALTFAVLPAAFGDAVCQRSTQAYPLRVHSL